MNSNNTKIFVIILGIAAIFGAAFFYSSEIQSQNQITPVQQDYFTRAATNAPLEAPHLAKVVYIN